MPIGEDTSPIKALSHSTVSIAGRSLHQVNATLAHQLKQADEPERIVWGQVDGTGTHPSRLVASHMAISEAIERWAWLQLSGAREGADYGFGEDATTTGMAAFPGLFARQARRHALREAVERWCLRTWWAGDLPCTRLPSKGDGSRQVQLGNPLSSHKVIVSWTTSSSNLIAYGIGCGRKVESASWRARIEQKRAEQALNYFSKKHENVGISILDKIPGYAERSFLYYAMPVGHAQFLQCIDHSTVKQEILQVVAGKKTITPVVDSPIPGPWTNYAHVWRVLYPLVENTNDSFCFYA